MPAVLWQEVLLSPLTFTAVGHFIVSLFSVWSVSNLCIWSSQHPNSIRLMLTVSRHRHAACLLDNVWQCRTSFNLHLRFAWRRMGTVVRDVVSVSTSRSRDGLETYQRLVSVSTKNVSGLVEVSWRVSAISSRRDVSCRRAQLNYNNSPIKLVGLYALFRTSRLR